MEAHVLMMDGTIHKLELDVAPGDPLAVLVGQVAACLASVTMEDENPMTLDDARVFAKGRPLENLTKTLADVGLTSSPLELVVARQRNYDDVPRRESAPPLSKALIEKATAHFAGEKGHGKGVAVAGGIPRGRRTGAQTLRALVATLAHIGTALQKTEDAPNDAQAEAADGAGDGVDPLQVDEESLLQLVGMGFPEAAARKALLLNRMSPILAMDWLLESDGDESVLLSALTEEQVEKIKRRKNTFKPTPAFVTQLQSMGFNKHDIYVALRASRNDLESACTWLLGDRGSMTISLDDDEPPQLLPLDDPLLRQLLEHPRVQAGLNSARVVNALQVLAANPNLVHRYLTDHEVAPVLGTITHTVQND